MGGQGQTYVSALDGRMGLPTHVSARDGRMDRFGNVINRRGSDDPNHRAP
jgi:hypothetical protein